jgi:hypothetical protein
MAVMGAGSTASGRCLANARYVVYITNGSSTTSWSGMTDADGEFSAIVSWSFLPGHALDLICETSRGDLVRRARTL